MNPVSLVALFALAGPSDLPVMSDARVAVIIGNNLGVEGDEPLAFAEDDAQRVHDLLIDVGGVERDRAYLVLGGKDRDVRRALDRAIGRISELSKSSATTLIVYASAHGDDDSLHLEGTRLSMAELRSTIAGAATTLRITFIDACRTARASVARGGHPGPEVRISTERSASVRGDVLIRSASYGESAQEWSFLRGGLFTHHLLSGLRGVADSDRDGRVSLTEAYAHAYHQTALRSASTRTGLQHPSFDLQMSGMGEWTMSVPEQMSSRLVLKGALEGEIWIADRGHRLVAELNKSAGETVSIGLRPGKYRIVRPDGTNAWVADVNLIYAGAREIGPEDLVRTTLRRAAVRGGDPVEAHPYQLAASYRAVSAPASAVSIGHGFDVSLARAFGDWVVRLRSGVVFAAVSSDTVVGTERTVDASIGLFYDLPLGFASLYVGAEGRASFTLQQLDRSDGRSSEKYDSSEPSRSAWIFGGGPAAGLKIPVTDRWWAGVEGGLGIDRVPLWNGEAEGAVVAYGRSEIGWSF